MTRVRQLAVLASVAGIALAFSGDIAAADPADFYRGKNLDLIISSSVGGGYDVLGRLVAEHMAAHIPGNPHIVPRNMPAAGGLAAMNFLYQIAPKDGSTFATVQNPNPFVPLFGEPAARFDALKFTYLGSANSEVAIAFVWKTSPVKTLQDAMTRETTMGTTGGGSTSAFQARAMNVFTGTKFKVITGYPGSTEAFLAVERGEVEGYPSIFWTTLKATKPDWLRENSIVMLTQLALEKHSDLPNVPLILDFAKTPEDRAALELMLASQLPGRPYLAPPSLPPDRAKALQDAFMATMADPRFLDIAKKRDLEIQPKSGPEVQAFLARIYQTPKAVVDKVNAVRLAGQ
ncbi:MAG TPA: tripartite tricarboxylate transporter substrate-binding protein [Alphaproteobacteria bacterium]|jgi:tripartite-type tricarboxylate transporter receptor subunit TctC|nr:tripartite tricarboxylate transporter substrate-binding protein [Alphaproteobacteria bacterium]